MILVDKAAVQEKERVSNYVVKELDVANEINNGEKFVEQWWGETMEDLKLKKKKKIYEPIWVIIWSLKSYDRSLKFYGYFKLC